MIKKNLDLESRIKRTIKWGISVIPTMDYKNPQDKKSQEGGGVMTWQNG